MQFEKVNDGIDVCKLLFARRLAALTQKCGELKCFADCAVGFVNIELFAVTCRSLEGDGQWAAVDEYFTMDGSI